jgi:ankyrin repeat protein
LKLGETPLYLAVEDNHKEMAFALIKKGADVKAKNEVRWETRASSR